MRLEWSDAALRGLAGIQPRRIAQRILADMEVIAENPFAPHSSVSRLQGREAAFGCAGATGA